MTEGRGGRSRCRPPQRRWGWVGRLVVVPGEGGGAAASLTLLAKAGVGRSRRRLPLSKVGESVTSSSPSPPARVGESVALLLPPAKVAGSVASSLPRPFTLSGTCSHKTHSLPLLHLQPFPPPSPATCPTPLLGLPLKTGDRSLGTTPVTTGTACNVFPRMTFIRRHSPPPPPTLILRKDLKRLSRT